ncbi:MULTISPECIES: permease [Halomonadaceae]|uniref:Permease n=2 Tax=Vreelandella TaxID=3137766 RepID=A0A7Z0LPT7_9GAMM|nr:MULTISPECIES: permease [Halomonas]NYS76358.1 permease [Halomonas glaciei]|tara:strand:- start:381 stop:1337 length:957 start_codon:yes stop_codon:yes gene_type:complete
MNTRFSLVWWATLALLALGSLLPEPSIELARSVIVELFKLLPLILFVALMAGWLASSQLADRVRNTLDSRPWHAIVFAGLIGAITPVCGIASVPLVAALLRQGIPMAAAMAFWLSSPVTDPGMLILTAGILGWPFAIGKLLAALLLGLVAGAVMQGLSCWKPQTHWVREGALLQVSTNSCDSSAPSRFIDEAKATFSMVVRWLAFALTLEAMVRAHLGETGFSILTTVDSAWAVPLAVAVGGPLYIEGYAALPLLRGLIDMGLTPGAAMAFLMSGATISLYSAIAVWSLVRPAIFGLYLTLGIVGALIAGWMTDLVML